MIAKSKVTEGTAAQSSAQATSADDGKLNRLVAAQLTKTKMCTMYAKGHCHDANCCFAHSQTELRSAPNLTKTAMCRMFARGHCPNQDCKFAHGEEELRVTPTVYKTQLCNFYQRGHCKKGSRCRHAHGDQELRSFKAMAKTGHDGEMVTNLADADALVGQGLESTPPHSSVSFGADSQLTPDKAVPAFPGGLQRPAADIAEPMKVPLPIPMVGRASSALPLHSPSPAVLDYPAFTSSVKSDFSSPSGRSTPALDPAELARLALMGQASPIAHVADHMAFAAQVAKAAELELQAAHLKAQHRIRYAAELAACLASPTTRPLIDGSDRHCKWALQEGEQHLNSSASQTRSAFDTIMHALRPTQLVPPSNYDVLPSRMDTPTPPPSVLVGNQLDGLSFELKSPSCMSATTPPSYGYFGRADGSGFDCEMKTPRAPQTWHPPELGKNGGMAWVI
jgi:hypothetical protein